MKTRIAALTLGASLVSLPAYAFDNFNVFPNEPNVELCYGMAMVGMDSVINSRLGVPAEHALDLARIRNRSVAVTDGGGYSTELLDNILNAYMWEGSPHSYAIRVFYRCAQNNSPVHAAANENVVVEPK